jgi:hypothetical protein
VADLANLVLAVDSTSVPKGTAALNELTAAGTRAEAAAIGLGRGSKTAAAEGVAMATAAQSAARAAMDQASGFKVATDAARINTLALRESLVVAREISRGNFTRIPGSLTLLAQGIGSQGGISSFLSAISQQIGLVKTLQNAELAEAATAAANAAAGVEAAARRASANVMAADTEIALAEAQVRVTEGTSAEAAAQARLAAAHEAVGVAAAEAAVAENALAVAMGRANEAQAASAAASRTVIGGAGIGLIGLGIVAAVAYGAVKQFQDQVKESGQLDDFADKLNLTDAQIKKLGGSVTYLGHNIKEVHGLTVTFGDVMYAVWHEIGREVSNAGPWNAMEAAATSAFNAILSAWNKVSAGISAGLFFIIDAGKAAINGSLFTGKFDAIGDIKSRYADELKRNADAFGRIGAGAIAHREKTLQDLSDGNNPRAPKKPRKESDHGLQEALDKLDAEIKGQYALAAAYQVSDVAAQRAIAHQKAAEDAIQHKGLESQFYAKELQKAVAEDVARQAKSNGDLQTETSIRARLNAQVANGAINLGQYNSELKLQTTLHHLNVDLENADAQHKGVVLNIIKQTVDLQTEQLQLEAQLNALKQNTANDNEIARLQLETRLIGSSNKERAVALAQLSAMQQLKEIDPNGLLTKGERNDFVGKQVLKAQLSVQTPFQQWAQNIHTSSAGILQDLQQIEFRGFDNLASSIADVATGTKSLGAAFRDISRQIINDIIQMTVRMLIFRAVSSIFGGSSGLGGAGAGLSAAGAVAGHRASGGPVSSGQTYLVGEKGPELFRPSSSGTIIPNHKVAANNNGPIEIKIGFGDAPDFAPYVQEVSAAHANQAVAISVDHTNKTLSALARPKLMGR